MNRPKTTDWRKIKENAQDVLSILLYFLLSPLWIIGLVLIFLGRFLSNLGNTILSFINSSLDKISSRISNHPLTAITILLYIARMILVVTKLTIQGLVYLLVFLINIIAFPLYLPYSIFGRVFMMVSKLEEESLETHKSAKSSPEWLKVSIAYPKLLSKRFEGTFLFQIYSTKNRSSAVRAIKKEFKGEQIIEQTASSSVQVEQKIKIKIFNPQIDFSNEVTKVVRNDVTKFTFLGTPKDNCQPGFHKVLISIIDAETGNEFESITIRVNVTDFAFDHVSKPLLSKVSSVLLGIGSFTMFTLSLLEQIDKTIGLTSGTAAGVLATMIYLNFFNLYQRTRLNNP